MTKRLHALLDEHGVVVPGFLLIILVAIFTPWGTGTPGEVTGAVICLGIVIAAFATWFWHTRHDDEMQYAAELARRTAFYNANPEARDAAIREQLRKLKP